MTYFQASRNESVIENKFTKTYDVGTQKNHLNEKVLLSTQNICKKLMGKKIFTILCRVAVSGLTRGTVFCPCARHFILCLVLVQPKKTP